MGTDYKNYSFYDNRPESESYELMRETNIPVLVRFLEDYSKNLYFQIEHGQRLINKDEIKVKANVMYSQFNEFKQSEGYTDIKYTATKVGIDFKRFNGITTLRKADGMLYRIDIKTTIELLKSEYKIEFVDYDEEDDEFTNNEN